MCVYMCYTNICEFAASINIYAIMYCLPLNLCSGARVLQHQLVVPGQDLLEAGAEEEGKGVAAKDSGF